MAWPEDIAIGLPPRRRDEPADLRRDIVDELADHLNCAMKRELRRTDDEAAARRAVIARFGNPARIASRLWFDAMKEQIMNQRIMLVTNILLAAACIVISITAFAAMRQNAEMGAALIEKIEAMGDVQEPTDASNVWAEAMMRIVNDTDAAEPVEGCRVTITGDVFNPGTRESLEAHTSADGTVSFGPIRPGKYSLRIYGPDRVSYHDSVILYPGLTELEPIAWPFIPPEPREVSFEVGIPEALRERQFYLACVLSRKPPSPHLDDDEWSWPSEQLLIAPDGRAMLLTEENWPLTDGLVRREGYNYRGIHAEKLRLAERITVDGAFSHYLSGMTVYVAKSEADATEGWYVSVAHPQRSRTRDPAELFADFPPFAANHDGETVWRLELPEWVGPEVEQKIETAISLAERMKGSGPTGPRQQGQPPPTGPRSGEGGS